MLSDVERQAAPLQPKRANRIRKESVVEQASITDHTKVTRKTVIGSGLAALTGLVLPG